MAREVLNKCCIWLDWLVAFTQLPICSCWNPKYACKTCSALLCYLTVECLNIAPKTSSDNRRYQGVTFLIPDYFMRLMHMVAVGMTSWWMCGWFKPSLKFFDRNYHYEDDHNFTDLLQKWVGVCLGDDMKSNSLVMEKKESLLPS